MDASLNNTSLLRYCILCINSFPQDCRPAIGAVPQERVTYTDSTHFVETTNDRRHEMSTKTCHLRHAFPRPQGCETCVHRDRDSNAKKLSTVCRAPTSHMMNIGKWRPSINQTHNLQSTVFPEHYLPLPVFISAANLEVLQSAEQINH